MVSGVSVPRSVRVARTDKKVISNNDRYSFFQAKTVTREQLAAKYLSCRHREGHGTEAGGEERPEGIDFGFVIYTFITNGLTL
jgi:hypothetical protein